jgi:hypothetical protein
MNSLDLGAIVNFSFLVAMSHFDQPITTQKKRETLKAHHQNRGF